MAKVHALLALCQDHINCLMLRRVNISRGKNGCLPLFFA